jgi:hypothetical protein
MFGDVDSDGLDIMPGICDSILETLDGYSGHVDSVSQNKVLLYEQNGADRGSPGVKVSILGRVRLVPEDIEWE